MCVEHLGVAVRHMRRHGRWGVRAHERVSEELDRTRAVPVGSVAASARSGSRRLEPGRGGRSCCGVRVDMRWNYGQPHRTPHAGTGKAQQSALQYGKYGSYSLSSDWGGGPSLSRLRGPACRR